MKEKIINIETINPLDFFGPNNQYLKQLQNHYPLVKFITRGTKIKLSGSEENVTIVNQKIQSIISFIEKYENIQPETFSKFLENNRELESEINHYDNILFYGINGKKIRAKTKNQMAIVNGMVNNDILFAIGPAGTGKTYSAVAMALKALKERMVKKIILTRPVVEAGENLGFLPGDLKDKIDPYLRPLYDALEDMLPIDKLNYYMTTRVIEIAPLAYMRGRTLDNAYIILDESQNATDLQLKMFLTRIGANAKAIITGDLTQIDLPKNFKSGLKKAVKILKHINGIEMVYLDETDVLRHRLVKEIIKSYQKVAEEKKERF